MAVQWPQQARGGGSSLFSPSLFFLSLSASHSHSHTFSPSTLLAYPTHLLLDDLPRVSVHSASILFTHSLPGIKKCGYDRGLSFGREVVT